MTDLQRGYNTTEKELLAVVMCMREYHDILYGDVINVYMGHKNLTFNTLSAPRVMRWKMFLEQYDINLTHIAVKKNVLADCFSRLPRMDAPSPGENENKGVRMDFRKLVVPKDEDDVFMAVDPLPTLLPRVCRNEDVDIIELFMNLPALSEMACPLTVANIQNHQAGDHALVQTALVQFQQYPIKVINGRNLVCYRDNPNANADEWRIYLPRSILPEVIRWYHMILGHPGVTRLYDTIRARFYAERLSVHCRDYICPDNCSQYKQQGRGYGMLPPRHAPLAPWNEVCIDLIGPWEIVVNGNICEFRALTCIDPVTNIVELIRITNKTMAHVAE